MKKIITAPHLPHPTPPILHPNRKGKWMRAGWPPQPLWPRRPATAKTSRSAATTPSPHWTPREARRTLPKRHLEGRQVGGAKAQRRWGNSLLTEPRRLTLFQGPASPWPSFSSTSFIGSCTRYCGMKMYINTEYTLAHTHPHTLSDLTLFSNYSFSWVIYPEKGKEAHLQLCTAAPSHLFNSFNSSPHNW